VGAIVEVKHQHLDLKHDILCYGDQYSKFELNVLYRYWLTNQSYGGIGRRAHRLAQYGLHEALPLLVADNCQSGTGMD
jgi:hypothetical protein